MTGILDQKRQVFLSVDNISALIINSPTGSHKYRIVAYDTYNELSTGVILGEYNSSDEVKMVHERMCTAITNNINGIYMMPESVRDEKISKS